MNNGARKLKPRLNGEFWMIGDNPDLGGLRGDGSLNGRPQECVDHHVYQSADGMWHLWGCIRNTAVGRILYHWKSDSLMNSHWERTGEIIRADGAAGESLRDWDGEEWIQSPYVIKSGNTFFMFYGGHTMGDRTLPTRQCDCQICLMTSRDGNHWTRHRDADGRSRIFAGPGETRDPCVIRIGSLWYLYYAGYEYRAGEELPGVYVRTSEDLIRWSPYRLVHRDRSGKFGGHNWDTECPHVVYRQGYYYLFRTENYALARTHVFRSADPMDFGIDGAGESYIGGIALAAPEIITDAGGREYVSSNHNLAGGTMMCGLQWETDE